MARGSFDVRQEIFHEKKARDAKWRVGLRQLVNTFAERLGCGGPSVNKRHGVTSAALQRLQPLEQRFVLLPGWNLRERADVGDFLECFSFHLKVCACVNLSRFHVHMP